MTRRKKAKRIAELELEAKELRRANEILLRDTRRDTTGDADMRVRAREPRPSAACWTRV